MIKFLLLFFCRLILSLILLNFSFNELFKTLYKDKKEIEEKTERMYEFYSQEKQDEYGVLGIKIKINQDN